jgi:hypothetical protein
MVVERGITFRVWMTVALLTEYQYVSEHQNPRQLRATRN